MHNIYFYPIFDLYGNFTNFYTFEDCIDFIVNWLHEKFNVENLSTLHLTFGLYETNNPTYDFKTDLFRPLYRMEYNPKTNKWKIGIGHPCNTGIIKYAREFTTKNTVKFFEDVKRQGTFAEVFPTFKYDGWF